MQYSNTQAYDMTAVFKTIAAALPAGENRTLLRLESDWYSGEFAGDDAKRETLPLMLSSSGEEIAALQEHLREGGVETEMADGHLIIRLADTGRQPALIQFSERKFSWIPEGVTIDDRHIRLPESMPLKSALAVCVLMARYPQLTVHMRQAPEIPKARFDELSQSFRRRIFRGLILGRRPSAGLKFLDSVGLLDGILPEVTAGRGLAQNRFHAYDIFEHLLRSVDGAMDLNEAVRWSALLHDVGKVPTRVEGPNGEASFHNHEMYSARMVVPIMKRCAVPIGTGQKVKFLVRNHMFHYTDEWTDKAVRRFVKKVPLEEMQDLISLRLADRKGSGKKTAFPKALQKLISHVDEIIAKEKEFKIKDLAIDGHKLMEMGMQPSREMGDMLKYLFEEVKSGRAENAEEALKALVIERRAGVTNR